MKILSSHDWIYGPHHICKIALWAREFHLMHVEEKRLIFDIMLSMMLCSFSALCSGQGGHGKSSKTSTDNIFGISNFCKSCHLSHIKDEQKYTHDVKISATFIFILKVYNSYNGSYLWKGILKKFKKSWKQSGAEVCQAQVKLGLTKLDLLSRNLRLPSPC